MEFTEFIKSQNNDCFHFLKWVEIISQESLAVKLDAMYILEKSNKWCDVIFVDSKGNKRKIAGTPLSEILKNFASIDASNLTPEFTTLWRDKILTNDLVRQIQLNEYTKKSDVVNNLFTSSATQPLSANQGKILDDKISFSNNKISRLEGMDLLWDPTTRLLSINDDVGRQISQISLLSLDNEGTDLRYNSARKTIDLYNDQNEVISSISISDFLGNVATQVQLSNNKLELKDSKGNVLSAAEFTVDNIDGLKNILDNTILGASNQDGNLDVAIIEKNLVINTVAKYNDGSKITEIQSYYDKNSNLPVNYVKTINWIDGSPMTDAKADGIFFRKIEGGYDRLIYFGPLNAKYFGVFNGNLVSDSLNKAIQVCKSLHSPLYIPTGTYVLDKPLIIPNDFRMFSDIEKCLFENAYNPVQGGWQLVNEVTTNCENISIENMIFNGATNGVFKINANNQAFLKLNNITFRGTQIGLQVNALCQTNTFTDCEFHSIYSGVEMLGSTNNLHSFYDCHFSGITKAVTVKNQGEAITFYSCRIEGGYIDNSSWVLDFESCTNIKFIGGYFESTNNQFLYDRSSKSGISFNSCHFTAALGSPVGSGGAAWQPFVFQSSGVVHFDTPYIGEDNLICDRYFLNGSISGKKNIIGKQITLNSNCGFGFFDKNKVLTGDENKILLFSAQKPTEEGTINYSTKTIKGKISTHSYVLLDNGFGFEDLIDVDFSILWTQENGYSLFQKNNNIKQTLFNVSLTKEDVSTGLINVFINLNADFTQSILGQNLSIKLDAQKAASTNRMDLKITV